MPARCEPPSAPPVVDDLAPPATMAITKHGLTIYYAGKAIMHCPRASLTGIAQRCLFAWHEGA